MARTVHCVKLGRELPGLEQLPFPGELGQRIYDNISQEAYESWHSYSTMLINHHGLSLGNPQHRDFLMQQMEEYFFGQGAEEIEGWIPPDQGPGAKGKGGGAPAAPSKK